MDNKTATAITEEIMKFLQTIPHKYRGYTGELWSKESIEFAVYSTLISRREEKDV